MSVRSLCHLSVIVAACSPSAAGQEPVARPLEESSERGAATSSARFEELGWELAAVDGGVRIERITKNSPAASARLQERDLITKVGGENVISPERILAILDRAVDQGESRVEVVVWRDGEELSYLISLDGATAEAGGVSPGNRAAHGNLVQMIQQLQRELQQQRLLLESALAELQSLRAQLGATAGPAAAPRASAASAQYTGEIVTPLGQSSGAATEPATPNLPPPSSAP
jgi:hypothetical protein